MPIQIGQRSGLGGTTITITLAVLLASCHAVRQHPSMIVLPGAQDLRRADIYDGQITYKLAEPYPGERTITEIRRRLTQLGWRPRERDLLNSTLSYDITARWRRVQVENGDLIGWSEQWENNAGDVVIYGFSYAVPVSGAEPEPSVPMEVIVSYFGVDTVRALEREATVKRKNGP